MDGRRADVSNRRVYGSYGGLVIIDILSLDGPRLRSCGASLINYREKATLY